MSIGKYGEINDVPGITQSPDSILYFKWKDMFSRCYNPLVHARRQGYVGCSVCSRWYTLSQFLSDIKKLPNYDKAKKDRFKGWALDKDSLVKGNTVYSPSTCCFLRIGENTLEQIHRNGIDYLNTPQAREKSARAQGRACIAIEPGGVEHEYYGSRVMQRELKVNRKLISNYCNGTHLVTNRQSPFYGWSFYWLDEYRKDV